MQFADGWGGAQEGANALQSNARRCCDAAGPCLGSLVRLDTVPACCHCPPPATAPHLPAGPYEFITFKETQGGCWPMHPLVVWRIVLVFGQVFFNGTRLLMGRVLEEAHNLGAGCTQSAPKRAIQAIGFRFYEV